MESFMFFMMSMKSFGSLQRLFSHDLFTNQLSVISLYFLKIILFCLEFHMRLFIGFDSFIVEIHRILQDYYL